MANELLEDAFRYVVTPDLIEKLSVKATDFTTLVSKLGLDPRKDFRHADLTGVDFSNADVDTFDFTGADLRGSFGVNVRKGRAKLNGAQLEGSLFEYQRNRSAFFSRNPDSLRMLRSLSSEHWTNATLWVSEHLRHRRRKDAGEIAEALFLDTKDGFLRNQILPYLSRGFENREAYLAFLLETLASHGANTSIRRAVIRVAGRTFYNQRSVFELLKRELKSDRMPDPTELLVALARSQWTPNEFQEVASLVRERTDDASRRLFVRAVATFQAGMPPDLLKDRSLAEALDFGGFVPDDVIQAIAWRGVRTDQDYQSTISERAKREAFIRRRLQALSDMGIDLEIEPPVEKPKAQQKSERKPFEVPEGRRILEG